MVLRALLTFWFLATSVLGPALCCCSSVSLWKVAQASATERVKPAAPVKAQGGCPHCKEKPASPTSPVEQTPKSPSKPCPAKCPCQDLALASAIPDDAGVAVRTLVTFTWLLVGPSLDTTPVVHASTVGATLPGHNHTGPPPLSGVERLRLLHVLVC